MSDSRLREAQAALEHDRTKVAECVTAMKHTLEDYNWLLDGRGSYEWDDDRYRQEFSNVCKALEKDLEPLSRIAADWSNCPTKWEDVQAARLTAPASPEPAVEALVAKWRKEAEEFGEIYKRTGQDRAFRINAIRTQCASELEAALAAKGAGGSSEDQ